MNNMKKMFEIVPNRGFPNSSFAPYPYTRPLSHALRSNGPHPALPSKPRQRRFVLPPPASDSQSDIVCPRTEADMGSGDETASLLILEGARRPSLGGHQGHHHRQQRPLSHTMHRHPQQQQQVPQRYSHPHQYRNHRWKRNKPNYFNCSNFNCKNCMVQ